MSKGSAFTRVIAYFRTADLTEATSCLQAATEVVASRAPDDAIPTKRHRRTKAEIAASRPTTEENAEYGKGAGA